MQEEKRGQLAIISGPSGSGKTSICRLLEKEEKVTFSISATTRPRRGKEQDGEDYIFLSQSEFKARVQAGDFLEWAEYNGQLYGTLRQSTSAALARGKVVILEIEVQGATKLYHAGQEGVYIFVEPPSMEVLEQRLRGRGTESDAEVERRIKIAQEEWRLARNSPTYNHFVVNDDLDQAVGEIKAILALV